MREPGSYGNLDHFKLGEKQMPQFSVRCHECLDLIECRARHKTVISVCRSNLKLPRIAGESVIVYAFQEISYLGVLERQPARIKERDETVKIHERLGNGHGVFSRLDTKRPTAFQDAKRSLGWALIYGMVPIGLDLCPAQICMCVAVTSLITLAGGFRHRKLGSA